MERTETTGRDVVRLFVGDHSHLAPLASGDIVAQGVALELVRDVPEKKQDRSGRADGLEARELSLARHVVRLGKGDRRWIAIPIFPLREFPHRFFFVRRGSGIRELRDLRGARIGVVDWLATGTVWGRVALEDAGLATSDLRWFAGSGDAGSHSHAAPSSEGTPAFVQRVAAERSLSEMLAAGDLDAIVGATPRTFHEPESPIVRLFPDYRTAERAFFQRTRLYPAARVVCIQAALVQRHPGLPAILFDALDRSRLAWQQRVTVFHGGTPWLQAELEETRQLMGADWQPNGVDANRPMIDALAQKLHGDGLIPRSMSADDVFSEFIAANDARPVTAGTSR